MKKLADILADCVRNVKALGPSNQLALVNAKLLDWEAECEAQAKDLLIVVALWEAASVATRRRALKVLFVVLSEEEFNLLRQEAEEIFCGLCDHEILGNSNLVEGQVESAVAVERNGANAKVCAAQIDSQIDTLKRGAELFSRMAPSSAKLGDE